MDKIIVVSRSGYAAGLVASASIQQQVIAVHDDPWVARTLNLVPGVSGIHLSKVDWQVPSSALHDFKEVNDGTLLRPEDVVLIVGANQGDDRDYFNSSQTLRVGGANQPALQPN